MAKQRNLPKRHDQTSSNQHIPYGLKLRFTLTWSDQHYSLCTLTSLSNYFLSLLHPACSCCHKFVVDWWYFHCQSTRQTTKTYPGAAPLRQITDTFGICCVHLEWWNIQHKCCLTVLRDPEEQHPEDSQLDYLCTFECSWWEQGRSQFHHPPHNGKCSLRPSLDISSSPCHKTGFWSLANSSTLFLNFQILGASLPHNIVQLISSLTLASSCRIPCLMPWRIFYWQ